jgi:4a-hydroxytetrahydrobiopterin dehydratase
MTETSHEDLNKKRCLPCEKLGAPLSSTKIQKYLDSLPLWQLEEDGKTIFRKYLMNNFFAAVRFINEIAVLAEAENHHPDIHLTGYRNVKIELSTHAIGGLSENDFILATKISQLTPELKKNP